MLPELTVKVMPQKLRIFSICLEKRIKHISKHRDDTHHKLNQHVADHLSLNSAVCADPFGFIEYVQRKNETGKVADYRQQPDQRTQSEPDSGKRNANVAVGVIAKAVEPLQGAAVLRFGLRQLQIFEL